MPLIRKPPNETSTPPSAADIASASPDVRWAAARQLRAPGDVAALAAALEQETEPRVREAIFTSLARIGGVESAQALARQIRSDDAGMRTGALDSLRGMTADVPHILWDLLSDPDPDVRLLACELARAAPSENAASLLCDLLERETEANVAGAAVEVLAEVGGPPALPVLARCAERFPEEPFLAFAIRATQERIGAQ